MMKILECEYIFTPRGYAKNMAIAFEDKIVDISPAKELKRRYPDCDIVNAGDKSILYPGFVNTHVHLEFSANKTQLKYGDFMRWLYSVLEKRENLIEEADEAVMTKACRDMLRSGITTIGAVSTYGKDLEVCRRTPQRVVFFNELVGSSAAMADALYDDFVQRVERSSNCDENERIIPAAAIHSPYSVHPVLLGRAVDLAREKSMPISAHFMESAYEREWLDNAGGAFLDFFGKFFKSSSPVNAPMDFLETFDGLRTLFVHCVHMNDKEREYMLEHGHYIAHCPRSNTLLGCGAMRIQRDNPLTALATDGLSSNWSLNIFDELRAAIMMHSDNDPTRLAVDLLHSVTDTAANALGMDTGRLSPGAPADFVTISLPKISENIEDLALQTIIHTNRVERVWIGGEEIDID